MANTTVDHEATKQRYVARVDDQLAGFAAYEQSPGLVTFTHTEIDDAFGGQGVGSTLVQGALDDLRSRGTDKVSSRCSFVSAWLERHPDYADLVAEA